MSINGIYQFGTLTTKSGKVINFEDIDLDKDGKISQKEYMFIQQELGLDTVEFIDEKQKGEKEVTDYEFIQYFQESQMQETFDTICNQVASDFIGSNAKYSSQVMKELRTFLKDFKEEYLNNGSSIGEMAAKFQEALPVKYSEIKKEVLGDDTEKDYTKVQEEWDKYVKDFEGSLKNASSITEFVKLNRDYLKTHGEYVQKMLACKDLDTEQRQNLIQESKNDLESAKYYTQLLGDGRNMQNTTDNFINKLAENCPGWKELSDNPIISNPELYMLQFFYEYRDNPNPLKKSMTIEYFEKLELEYSILESKYQNLVESGEIDPNDNVEFKQKEGV